jgi:hypothetical protein
VEGEVNDNICEQCGTRNEPGAQFCVECGAFLPWYDTRETNLQALGIDTVIDTGSETAPAGSPTDAVPTAPVVEAAPITVTRTVGAAAVPGTPITSEGAPSDRPAGTPRVSRVTRRSPEAADQVRVVIEPATAEVVPGGDEVSVEVQIYNLSPIVDAYRVTAPDAPAWLTVGAAEVRLLPNSNELATITLRILAGTLVPAGTSRLLVRVQSVAHPEMAVDEHIELTVAAVMTPLVLRVEPSVVRAKDAEPGRFRATIDNSGGNQGRRVTLTGRDTEGVVRFTFTPAVIEVPPGESATADARIEAPAPEPGQQSTRQLTVTAADGESHVESTVTFLQAGSVEVPMTLLVEPSLLRARDSAAGQLEVTIDNRNGTRTRRVFLNGRDPERLVRFSFFPPSLDVFAGEVGRARLRVEAQPPPAGQEVSRALSIIATSPGAADLQGTATFVQTTSAAPVDTPVALKLDPSVVRVRDTAVGQLEAIVDNRAGTRVRRVFLTGRDPERLVRFTFSPPSLDVLPGEIGRARVRMEAQLPEPGQEATRQVTVVAADGNREIEASGTFGQITSPKPVETPVALKLEPSLIRVRDSTFGQFQVVVDNRQGIRPRRVALAGTDPERALQFSFWPPVVDVDRGQIARSNVRVDGYPPEPGREVTRQFAISASDGAKEVETDGTFIQASSPPAPDEPMTLRLEPSVIRVRNSGSGSTTVYADNRGGSRPRRVQFGGHDPERVIRFAFTPPVIDLAPGQMGGVRVQLSAPRPDGGAQVTRPFTIVASDGAKDTDSSGSFVQEASDRRPLWRIALTVIGALLMIAGVFLSWTRSDAFRVTENDAVSQLYCGNPAPAADLNEVFGAVNVLPDGITGLEWRPPELKASTLLPCDFNDQLLQNLGQLVSAGAVVILLAIVALLGLFGPKGVVTRLAALVAAVGLVGFVVVVQLVNVGRPDLGVVVIVAGCVLAFIGGALAKPARG